MKQCKFNPKEYKKSIGWFDCPECGLPVCAGYHHPKFEKKKSNKTELSRACETCDVLNNPNCDKCLGC